MPPAESRKRLSRPERSETPPDLARPIENENHESPAGCPGRVFFKVFSSPAAYPTYFPRSCHRNESFPPTFGQENPLPQRHLGNAYNGAASTGSDSHRTDRPSGRSGRFSCLQGPVLTDRLSWDSMKRFVQMLALTGPVLMQAPCSFTPEGFSVFPNVLPSPIPLLVGILLGG